jgi:hypothetical protein
MQLPRYFRLARRFEAVMHLPRNFSKATVLPAVRCCDADTPGERTIVSNKHAPDHVEIARMATLHSPETMLDILTNHIANTDLPSPDYACSEAALPPEEFQDLRMRPFRKQTARFA